MIKPVMIPITAPCDNGEEEDKESADCVGVELLDNVDLAVVCVDEDEEVVVCVDEDEEVVDGHTTTRPQELGRFSLEQTPTRN